MPEINTTSRNWAPLMGLLLALAAFLSNLAIFMRPPGERAIPLLSLALAVIAMIVVVIGVRRAFTQNRGKVLSSILGVVTLLVCGVTGFAYFGARQLPKSAGAPKIGDKAPDFTLPDTTAKPVSLAQLLASSEPPSSGAPPASANDGPKTKAVLLVFYRGYW